MVYYKIQQRNNYSVVRVTVVSHVNYNFTKWLQMNITLNVLLNVTMLQKVLTVNINVLNHVQKTTSMNK